MLALLAFAGPAAGAESSGTTQQQAAEALGARSSTLSGAARAVWLSVLSLETRLAQTEAALARLDARTEAIARARAETEAELRLATRNLRVLERRLASRLRGLYVQGDADPLAVVLGSSSMGEALEGLDSLNRVAAQDRQLVAAARAARKRLIALAGTLRAREAEARRADEAAAATAVSLAAARAERAQTPLRSELRRPGAQAVTPSKPTLPPRPVADGRKLRVTATGYALRGMTATGVSVGWGIVAVDPGVIALGTRISIPGYGEGVAADTGSAVRGARIDLWFPTTAEARAWGSRTITITLL